MKQFNLFSIPRMPKLFCVGIFSILSLFSCSPEPETQLPSCPSIDAFITTRDGSYHLSMVIHSDEPTITYIRDDGRSFTVSEHYYHCIHISVDYGEVITFPDLECEIVAR